MSLIFMSNWRHISRKVFEISVKNWRWVLRYSINMWACINRFRWRCFQLLRQLKLNVWKEYLIVEERRTFVWTVCAAKSSTVHYLWFRDHLVCVNVCTNRKHSGSEWPLCCICLQVAPGISHTSAVGLRAFWEAQMWPESVSEECVRVNGCSHSRIIQRECWKSFFLPQQIWPLIPALQCDQHTDELL